MSHQVTRSIENGIERIVCIPENRRFQTPILMQHGMWHGAWTWEHWQPLFADWGWETHAHSLPGHGGSPVQRPIRWATLNYYFRFLKAEIERLPRRPILMGHSMGGALTQWYLKYGGDDLPASVLVAPWTSHMMLPSVVRAMVRDPIGAVLCTLTLTTTPMVRNPFRAQQMFTREGAILSPEVLHSKLGPESTWVLAQYNPPFWSPPRQRRTPLLWLAGANDTLISEPEERRSAAHYGAEYIVIPDAGHNIMMEKHHGETAERIHRWLEARKIG
jgi:pimeloyl-ACP methyl ester carboxylesterase